MDHRTRAAATALALALCLDGVAAAPSRAATVVLDYDGDAAPSEDFRTTPYREDGTTTTVDAGHYEISADAGGADGDFAFNLDEQGTGLSRVTITVDGGMTFDAQSLEVVNPAETAGEVTISAVGGAGGSISAPTVAGPLALGPAFAGVSALVIRQHAPGAFSFDDLTLQVLPEPAALPAFLASALLLAALRRRDA